MLAARDLACRRGNRVIFRGLNLAVHAGQLVWLRGSNGSGKTSLLRLLIGLGRPDAGSVLWQGEPVRRFMGGRVLPSVYVAHANALKEDLTVAEALAFNADLHGRDTSIAAIVRALGVFGIAHLVSLPVRTLSQGQRRRVALSQLAMCGGPALWILDEPFDALDVQSVARLNQTLIEHLGRGGAIVLTSHQALALEAVTPIVFDMDSLH